MFPARPPVSLCLRGHHENITAQQLISSTERVEIDSKELGFVQTWSTVRGRYVSESNKPSIESQWVAQQPVLIVVANPLVSGWDT